VDLYTEELEIAHTSTVKMDNPVDHDHLSGGGGGSGDFQISLVRYRPEGRSVYEF